MNTNDVNASVSTSRNILKSREDCEPVEFFLAEDSKPEYPSFRIKEDTSCSWIDASTSFGTDKLRDRVQPWLTALCQSEHLALLVGSGLTHAVHYLATEKKLPGMNIAEPRSFGSEIKTEMKRTASIVGRGEGNVEDQIRATRALIHGLEIITNTNKQSAHIKEFMQKLIAIKSELNSLLESFASSILEGETSIITAPEVKREQAFNYLVSFLMSFASRTGTRDRLQLFTTNYDRLIEAGADAAGLHLVDRFVGSLAPVFRSSRLDVDLHYNPPGIRGEPRYLEGVARFTKLHGSIDWMNNNQTVRKFGLPFGSKSISPYLNAPGLTDAEALGLMIYPNETKDRETAGYPYVELFRDLASSVCRPNSTLITFGYSFGDEHINRVIEDMLTIPSTHLVVISRDDTMGRIMGTYRKLGRNAQMTLLVGSHIGDFKSLVDNYLPKPSIDRATIRMAELLKARWGISNIRESIVDSQTNKGDTP